MFFVISSFLLFSRLRLLNGIEQKKIIKKWVLRNIYLYSVWFVILLPVTVIVRRSWFDNGILWGTIIFIRNVFLGSTFQASWFITANVMAVIIAHMMTRKTGKNIPVLLVSCVFYLLCCLSSSYPVVTQFLGVDKVLDLLNVRSNFCVALLWTVIGKMFAEDKIKISRNVCKLGLLLSLVVLLVERRLTVRYAGALLSSDFMVTLVPVTLCLFAWLIKAEGVKLPCATLMRKSSTLIYVMHCSMITVLMYVLPTSWIAPLPIFVMTVCGTLIISLVIIRLSNCKKFGFLKMLW